MFSINTIQKKILYTISALAIATVLLRTVIFSSSDYQTAKDEIHQQILTQLQADTLRVSSFFSQYGRVADILINSPEVIDWLLSHKERGKFKGTEEGYHGLNRVLHAVSDRDEYVLSAFFASEATQEYFAEDRVTGMAEEGPEFDQEKGYFVGKRPWYNKVIEFKEMLTTSPAVDIITGAISLSVEQVMYHNGELLGAGGIDISLKNISRVSQAISFNGEGFAALFDEKWQNVTFPNDIIKRDINTPIADYDNEENVSGFSQIPNINSQTLAPINIKGEDYYAVRMPITTQMPKMTWQLILFVPSNVLDDPAKSAVIDQIVYSLIVLLVIIIVLAGITTYIAKPIAKLTDAFASVAEGDSDLTLKLDVTSNDETGKLAGYFNTFLQKLHRVITGVASDKALVAKVSQEVENISKSLIDKTQQDKLGLDSASVAASELLASASEIEQKNIPSCQ